MSACCVVLAALITPVPIPGAEGDHFAAAVDTLRRAATPSLRGDNHTLVVSLRAMRDPDLRSFFETLAQSGDWAGRIDGLLALAELSTDQDIDPFMLSRLADAGQRSAAIQGAIGLSLVQPGSAREILTWTDLNELDRVVLTAELQRRGEPWDAQPIRQITADERVPEEVRSLAAMLLLEAGDPEPWAEASSRTRELPAPRRNIIVQEIGKAAQTYRLGESVAPLLELAAEEGTQPQTAGTLVGCALALNPKLGLDGWTKSVQRDRSGPALLRGALQFLLFAEQLPADRVAAVRNGDPLIEAVADAAAALSIGDDAVTAQRLCQLISIGNRQTSEWAIRAAQRLPSAEAAVVLRHVLSQAQGDSPAAPGLRGALVEVGARLVSWDAPAVRSAIENSTDPICQELLLLGLNQSASKQSAEVASAVRKSLSRRADALALLAMARGLDSLDPQTLEALGLVAAGGAGVDPTLRVQAAWLFAKHSGRSAEALAAVHP